MGFRGVHAVSWHLRRQDFAVPRRGASASRPDWTAGTTARRSAAVLRQRPTVFDRQPRESERVQVRGRQGYDWRLPLPRAGQPQGLRIYPCARLNTAANCSIQILCAEASPSRLIGHAHPRALRPLSGGSGASKRHGESVLAVSQPAAPASA